MEKTRITPEKIAEWEELALMLIESGNNDARVNAHLRAEGCTPKLAMQLVGKARKVVRGHHRKAGMKGVGVGVALLGLGLLIMAVAVGGIPIGDWRVYSGKLVLVGGAVALAGTMPVLLGLYKMFTGSTVEIDEPQA